MSILRTSIFAAFVLSSLACMGCSKKPPEVIAAGGTVTLNGAPLPHADIRFYPMEPGLDGNFVANAVSDNEGKFTLKLMGQQDSGVCLGKHQVTVMEGPLPDEARGESESSQNLAVNFVKSLKNRPIPPAYANLVTSNLLIEIVPGQTEYNLELTR